MSGARGMLGAAEERLADDAFAAMWKLRDRLEATSRTAAFAQVEAAIAALQAACREA